MQDMEKQLEKKPPRIKELDSFKGFLIFAVVLGHFLLPLKDSAYPLFQRSFYLIYSFHMPAFVFLSGYFGYSGWKKRGTSFRSLLSYAFLYLFMQGMLHLCDIFFYGSTGIFPDFWHASSTPWYILALIFWNLAMIPAELFLGKKREGKEITVYLLFLILLSIPLSFLEVGRTLKDFLALDRTLSFAPFYFLGFLAKCNHVSFQKIYTLPAALGMFSALLLSLFLPILLPYTRVFYGTWGYRMEREEILPFFKSYPILLRIVYIPLALCIAYFFFSLLQFLLEGGKQGPSDFAFSPKGKLSDKLVAFLQKMGEYTLPVFVFHRPFRDAFFAYGADRYFLEGGLPLRTVALFYLFLICVSLILMLLLGRKALDEFCRFRFLIKKV